MRGVNIFLITGITNQLMVLWKESTTKLSSLKEFHLDLETSRYLYSEDNAIGLDNNLVITTVNII